MLRESDNQFPFPAPIEAGWLEFEFQPIADIGQAAIFGYEALMRGPAGSPLRGAEELLRAAKAAGRMAELERAACLGAITTFASRALPGKLFLNLSASMIEEFARDGGRVLLDCARRAGLQPGRLVLELTEHERVDNVPALQAAMGVLAEQGVTLALDDFGDGRSSLRLWVQLRPQLVKLDKYFVRGVMGDSRKLEVIRSVLRQLAQGRDGPVELVEDPSAVDRAADPTTKTWEA